MSQALGLSLVSTSWVLACLSRSRSLFGRQRQDQLLFSRGQNAQDGNHDEVGNQVYLDILVLWHINLCSKRLMPSHTAASISPCVFIVTPHVSCPAVDALPGRDGDSATPETLACRLLARQDVEPWTQNLPTFPRIWLPLARRGRII